MKKLVVLLIAALGFAVASPALAWTWPVDGDVVRAYVFGDDPYAGGQHRGIDLAAAPGTEVRAPASGTVTFRGFVPSGGTTLTLETADGYSVTLQQLGSITVAKGDTVSEGTIVASSGASSDATTTQAHVHLGVRVAGERHGYVDPSTLLPPRPRPVSTPPEPGEPAGAPGHPASTSEQEEPAPTVAPPPNAVEPPAEPGQAERVAESEPVRPALDPGQEEPGPEVAPSPQLEPEPATASAERSSVTEARADPPQSPPAEPGELPGASETLEPDPGDIVGLAPVQPPAAEAAYEPVGVALVVPVPVELDVASAGTAPSAAELPAKAVPPASGASSSRADTAGAETQPTPTRRGRPTAAADVPPAQDSPVGTSARSERRTQPGAREHAQVTAQVAAPARTRAPAQLHASRGDRGIAAVVARPTTANAPSHGAETVALASGAGERAVERAAAPIAAADGAAPSGAATLFRADATAFSSFPRPEGGSPGPFRAGLLLILLGALGLGLVAWRWRRPRQATGAASSPTPPRPPVGPGRPSRPRCGLRGLPHGEGARERSRVAVSGVGLVGVSRARRRAGAATRP